MLSISSKSSRDWLGKSESVFKPETRARREEGQFLNLDNARLDRQFLNLI